MATNTTTIDQLAIVTSPAGKNIVVEQGGVVNRLPFSNLQSEINPTKLNGKTQAHVGEVTPAINRLATVGWYRIGESCLTKNSFSSALICIGQSFTSYNAHGTLVALSASIHGINATRLSQIDNGVTNLTKMRWVRDANKSYLDIYVAVAQNNNWYICSFGTVAIYDTFVFEPDTSGSEAVFEATL